MDRTLFPHIVILTVKLKQGSCVAASFKISWALVPLRTSTHAGEGGLLPSVYFVALNFNSTQTRILRSSSATAPKKKEKEKQDRMNKLSRSVYKKRKQVAFLCSQRIFYPSILEKSGRGSDLEVGSLSARIVYVFQNVFVFVCCSGSFYTCIIVSNCCPDVSQLVCNKKSSTQLWSENSQQLSISSLSHKS